MAYATTADMIARFGEAEMISLTADPGNLAGPVVTARSDRALAEASALIDSYLRRRYLVPLAAAPAEILRACCILARYDLAQGEQRDPTEQMRLARKETIAWLEMLASGTALLDGVPLAGSAGAGGRVQDRERVFSDSNFGRW